MSSNSLKTKDTETRRKELVKRLKAILLDEVDELVLNLFIQENEVPYWEHSNDLRVQQEFKSTVSNVWVMLSCITIQRNIAIQIAFLCGKSLVEIKESDIRLVVNFFSSNKELAHLVIFLQNINFFEDFYPTISRHIVEKFLFKLHKNDVFKTTRLDKHCLDWSPEKHETLKLFLEHKCCKRALKWLLDLEEESKKFISNQMNSRANTLLKDQLKDRTRQDFVKSNAFDDALCFEDIFYVLKRINDCPIAHVCDSSISKESVLHGTETMEETCRKLLKEVLETKENIQHAYLLKNEVEEGVMGHWTVMCYQRLKGKWTLCQYFNPSGQGFRCGDRCIKWIFTHALNQNYVNNLPEDIISKLFSGGNNIERQITWDMTECTKQMEDYVEVSVPTYIMADEGEMVNLLPIDVEEDSEDDDEDSSTEISSVSSSLEDYDDFESEFGSDGWLYIPTVMEVLSNSFTQEEIRYMMEKHGFGPTVNLREAIEKMTSGGSN